MATNLLRGIGLLLLGTAATACASEPRVPVCLSPVSGGDEAPRAVPDDTLDVPVVLLSPDAGEVELLVRVDRVAEEGIVRFGREGAPPPAPAVAAAGVILAPGSRYRVCFGEAPLSLAFQAETAPEGKIWARVSTDRPVRAWIQAPGDGADAPPGALRIDPGASGREVFWPGGGE